MRAIFYDTETNGLPLWSDPSSDPSSDPRQPHIVQLAAALVDLDTRATLASIDLTIKPDGWTIPDDIAAIHGITTEMAQDTGVPEAAAVQMLMELWNANGKPRLRIGHNESFDMRIVRIALSRITGPEAADLWKAGQAACTQKLATPIVKAAPTEKMLAAGRNHTKTANLSEAYLFFTGKELVGAHSALADALACKEVYFAIADHHAVAA